MTQPAFSRRIRALEEWLGVVLVDRTTHPAVLTEAGEWFRSVAQEILARVAQIPGRGARDRGRHFGHAAHRVDARAVVHVPAVVAAQPRVAHRHRADPARERRAAALRGADAAGTRPVPVVPCARPGADAPRFRPYRSAVVGSDVLIPVSAPDADGKPKFALNAQGRGRVAVLAYSAESGIGRIVRALARRRAGGDRRGRRLHGASRLGAQDHGAGRAGHRLAAEDVDRGRSRARTTRRGRRRVMVDRRRHPAVPPGSHDASGRREVLAGRRGGLKETPEGPC